MSRGDSTSSGGDELDRHLRAFVDEAGTDAARNVLHELQSQLSVEPTGLPVSGTMLGEYRLLREIGRGGMGVIFEAEQTSVPGRRVAIKLLARSAASELRLNRFRREIEVIGRLDHMNIVPILSADLSGEVPWYAMKLVLGRTLRELLDDGELFDFGQMASIFRELAWALDHAHCKGVVHRDVNARNIMLDAQGKAQLLDFGLAHDDLSQTVLTLGDDALGTAEYMSPEQVSGRGGDICPATDVYGLGATLYRCLCGRPPFSGRTLHEVFERILAGHPTALRKLRPDVPPDLAAICLQAMAPDIGSRYESAGEMAQDLTAFLEYGPVHARSPGFVRRGLRMVRQHRGVALVTAIALLFAAGVWLEGSWWTPRRLLSMQDVAARAGDLDQVTQLSQRLHEDFAQTSFAEEGQGVQSRLIRSKIDDGLAALSERIARDDLADEALALAYDELSGLGAAGLAHEGLQRARADHAAACLTKELRQLSQLLNPVAVALWSGRLRDSSLAASYLGLLDSNGSLSVTAPGAPAQVLLFRPLVVGGRMAFDERDAAAIDLGMTPTKLQDVPEGSYLLVARRDGFVDTRLPLLVRRSAIQERREVELSVELLTAAELGQGWRFIPAGDSVLGGGSSNRAHELTWVESFCIMEEEVSEALLRDWLWQPGEPWERQVSELKNIFSESPGVFREPRDRAVGRVRALDINSVLNVLNRREALLGAEGRWFYRLPRSDEWERVGRGADGRLYPWGMSYERGLCSDYHYCTDEDHHYAWRPSPPGDTSPFGVRSLAGGQAEICVPDDLLGMFGQGVFLTRGGSTNARTSNSVSLLQADLVDQLTREHTIGFRLVKERLPDLGSEPVATFNEGFDDSNQDGTLTAGWVERRFHTGVVAAGQGRATQHKGQLELRGYADSFSEPVVVAHPVSVPGDGFRLKLIATVDLELSSDDLRVGFTVGLTERPEWIDRGRHVAVSLNTAGRFGVYHGIEAEQGPFWDDIAGQAVEIELISRDGQLTGFLRDHGESKALLSTIGPMPIPDLAAQWRPTHVFFIVGNLQAVRVTVDTLTLEPLGP